MKFLPLASSSKGNAYFVQSDGVAPLLLEAGIPIKQLRDKLREHWVMLSDLAGCCISHSHADHSRAVKDLLRSGIDLYMSFGTSEELEVVGHYRTHDQQTPGKWILPGGWTVLSFKLDHDTKDPTGFLICHGYNRLLFIPDTSRIDVDYMGVTLLAIEVNYQDDILNENIGNGHLPSVVGERTKRTHLSLESVKEYLSKIDLSQVREIWLIHLSNSNSSEENIISEIRKKTGIPVYVARE